MKRGDMAYEYVVERWDQIWFASWQHFSLVVQCLVLAMVIAVGARRTRLPQPAPHRARERGVGHRPDAAVVRRHRPAHRPARLRRRCRRSSSSTFFAALPILRNAVVGLTEIDARRRRVGARHRHGPRSAPSLQVELPLAWPIILTGVRVSRADGDGHRRRRRLRARARARRLHLLRACPASAARTRSPPSSSGWSASSCSPSSSTSSSSASAA